MHQITFHVQVIIFDKMLFKEIHEWMSSDGEAAFQCSTIARNHGLSFAKGFWKMGEPFLSGIYLLLECKPTSLAPLPMDNAPCVPSSALGTVIKYSSAVPPLDSSKAAAALASLPGGQLVSQTFPQPLSLVTFHSFLLVLLYVKSVREEGRQGVKSGGREECENQQLRPQQP